MDTAKTTTLTFRTERGLKEALRMPADRDRRSIANIVDGVDPVSLRAEQHCYSGATAVFAYKQKPSTETYSQDQNAKLLIALKCG